MITRGRHRSSTELGTSSRRVVPSRQTSQPATSCWLSTSKAQPGPGPPSPAARDPAMPWPAMLLGFGERAPAFRPEVNRVVGSALLLDVGPQDVQWSTSDRAGVVRPRPQPPGPPVVPGKVGELLPQPPGRDALEAVDEPGQCDGWGKVDQQVDVLGLAVELDQFAAEVLTDRPHDRRHAVQVDGGEHRMPVLRHENQVGVQRNYAVPACTKVPILSHRPSILVGVRLRYRYRLDPDPAQRRALAKAFGCARVVFNDGLRARQDADKAGRPYLSDGELSRRLTVAKGTPERAWLGEVSRWRCSSRSPTSTAPTATTSARSPRPRQHALGASRPGSRSASPGSSRGTTIRRCGSRPTAASGCCPTAGCRSPRSAS